MVISDGCTVDNGSQFIKWSGGNTCSFGSSGLKSGFLSGSLVKPNSDVGLPVFSKMDIGDDVVVFDH